MKLRRFLALILAFQITLLPWAGAQLFKPIDPNKKADIDTKSLNLGTAQFETVSEPTHEVPNASLSKGDLKLPDFETKQVDFQTLEKPTIVKPVLPQASFTATNIAVKVSDESNKNLNHATVKAPVTNRQIRPFAPGGEQELKKQLSEPH
jgi:hypothetical protein